jgi:hypothetical protein
MAASLVRVAPAHALDPAEEAAAVALFNEAKALANAGDFVKACPKFEEVRRVLPTAGLLLNLGNCYEKLGKLASAWGLFKEAEIRARGLGESDRQAEALKRAQAIEGALSKLVIAVSPASRTPGLEVKRDGAPVGEGQWGSAVPVDAGEHVVEAKAPGRKAWSTKVTVGPNGASGIVQVPELQVDDTPPPEAGGLWWGPQRIAGVTVAGAGVVGVVLGSVFGAQAISKNNASKVECSPMDPSFCTDAGVALRSDAKTAGTVSTVALAVGGAAAVGGVVLFFTAPKQAADKPAITVTARPFGVGIEGRW